MPIITEFDSAPGVLRVAATDRPALVEFRQAVERITSGVHYPPTVPTIWDLRALDFTEFDTQTIRKISAILSEFPDRKIAKAAYVVADQLGYGMMRMLQAMTETTENSQVFYDYAKADQWLAAVFEPRKELDPLADCQVARRHQGNGETITNLTPPPLPVPDPCPAGVAE